MEEKRENKTGERKSFIQTGKKIGIYHSFI